MSNLHVTASALRPAAALPLSRDVRSTVVAVALCLYVGFAAPLPLAHGQTLISKGRERAVQASLIGQWTADVGKMKVQLRFTGDGRFVLDGRDGEYTVTGNALKLRSQEDEVAYQFDLAANELTLSGGDLAQPLKFTRVREAGSYVKRLLASTQRSAREKLYRILLIVAVVFACRVILVLLRALSHFMIYADWGPLKFLYRYRKNRAMTMHSLALNVCKYIIYFTALGFVLTEMGVNYTAYLASLSVVGLAIAFGSQGLVQDMVTGFFVIFEGQFDVGDMVEIPPQTGIVQELGLRVTTLRNYLGQQVVIPNRNIATIGTYSKGAQQACVDVAVSDRPSGEKAIGPITQLAEEIARQFDGIILTSPEVQGIVSLANGEHFVRLRLSIWPQQQWVIEGQLVPRIREVLKRSGVEVPEDRIAVFYHPREEHTAPTLRRILKRREKPHGASSPRR